MSIFESQASFLAFVAEELQVDSSSLHLNQKFRELSAWTSLNALFLMTRISEEKSIFITSSELANCHTFEDIFNLISSKENGAHTS